jgi:basic membrane protein A
MIQMRKSRTTLLVLMFTMLLGVLALSACAGSAPAEEPAEEEAAAEAPATEEATEAPAEGEALKFVYVSPNPLGVNEFLIMGDEGTQMAGEKYGAETQTLESEAGDPTSLEANVRAAVNEGANIVIVIGFEFNDIIPEVAPEAPDVQFLIVDQCIENPPPNVSCAVFREYEGSFLVGATAAMLTETDHVGVIGAIDIPFLHRYTDAFAEGAQYVNPDITVDTLWVGGDNPFADPARAKEQALAMAADGADQIYAATSAGNLGVFEAAEEQDFYAYGVDINQCPEAPGHIVENMTKRVDLAVMDSVDAIMAGEVGQTAVYGLDSGNMGLVAFTSDDPENSQCVVMEHPDVLDQLETIQQQIIDGEIVIEDPMAAE